MTDFGYPQRLPTYYLPIDFEFRITDFLFILYNAAYQVLIMCL